MKELSLQTISVVTDAAGDFTVDTTPLKGRLLQYRYVPDGTSPLDTGADVTVVGEKTGFTMLTLTNIGTSAFQGVPRQPVNDGVGAASLYAAAGEPVEDDIYVDEKLTITVAQGGNTKSGTLYLWVG